ncbi:MAG: sirohydrochlorin chelatase [Propionibacteriales bacterium]|nr:sirohydrochlorin chelatase [Propionibacteriales bacterium]
MTPPDLVLVAHGTRDPQGPRVLDRLVSLVRAELPGVRTRLSYVELVPPLVEDVMTTVGRPTVVVPLLLSTGYHVKHDLPRSVGIAAAAGVPVALTAPLGPDRLLAGALADRLAEAGAEPGDPVVLAAAGSSDAGAGRAVDRTAAMLRDVWRAPVACAYASMGVTVPEVMRGVRAEAGRRRVSLVPYLLAPGRFASEVRRDARMHDARTAEVLGTHGAVVELIRRRYARAAALLGQC